MFHAVLTSGRAPIGTGQGDAGSASVRCTAGGDRQRVMTGLLAEADESELVYSAGSSAGRPVPVVMLTARGDEADRVAGLESGADDYLTEPFSPRELVLRVAAVLRRTASPPSRGLLPDGDLVVDLAAREARRTGLPLALTSARTFVQGALVSAGLVTVVAIPMIYRAGSQPRARAILDQDFRANLAILVALLSGVAVMAYLRRVTRARSTTGG